MENRKLLETCLMIMEGKQSFIPGMHLGFEEFLPEIIKRTSIKKTDMSRDSNISVKIDRVSSSDVKVIKNYADEVAKKGGGFGGFYVKPKGNSVILTLQGYDMYDD